MLRTQTGHVQVVMMVAQENNIIILMDIIHGDGWQWWNFGFGGPIENILFKLCATCHNTFTLLLNELTLNIYLHLY